MEQEQEEILRIRTPKEGEILGLVIEMLGTGKLRVECEDGFTRICRIPGKMRKRVWVRNGDLVLIEPWKVQEKERADIAWRYSKTQANWLKRKGIIKKLAIE